MCLCVYIYIYACVCVCVCVCVHKDEERNILHRPHGSVDGLSYLKALPETSMLETETFIEIHETIPPFSGELSRSHLRVDIYGTCIKLVTHKSVFLYSSNLCLPFIFLLFLFHGLFFFHFSSQLAFVNPSSFFPSLRPLKEISISVCTWVWVYFVMWGYRFLCSPSSFPLEFKVCLHFFLSLVEHP